jgi:hypothetical protein
MDALLALEVIEVMENFLEHKRPHESIRAELDIGYSIENQSVIIFEIRPQWRNPSVIQHHPVAKTTFVKSRNSWKVFWMRSDLKWHAYPPKPFIKKIRDFVKLIEADEHHCFWG